MDYTHQSKRVSYHWVDSNSHVQSQMTHAMTVTTASVYIDQVNKIPDTNLILILDILWRCATLSTNHCSSVEIILLYQFCHVFIHNWGRMAYIYIGKLTTNGSDNGLAPSRRQIIAEILHFNRNQTYSLKKICLKMSSMKCCPFRRGLNVLRCHGADGWMFDHLRRGNMANKEQGNFIYTDRRKLQ